MVEISGYDDFSFRASGGFSEVFEARQVKFNRRVAVKVLTAADDGAYSRSAFERECRVMGMVSEHPNVVTIFDSGFTHDSRPFIAMELYEQTLLDRIRAERFLPLADVLHLGVLVAAALHRAHEEPILHRDIKPQNIFISRYGEPALGDFGIASMVFEPQTRNLALTEHYAAPEVLEGDDPTVSADLYSLGATLYTALAGHRPFALPGDANSSEAVHRRIMSEPPPPIAAQEIPPFVERELLSLLAKHPYDRPGTALATGQMLRDLQAHLGQPVTPWRQSNRPVDNDTTRARKGGIDGTRPANPVPVGTEPPDLDPRTKRRGSPPTPVAPTGRVRLDRRAALGAGALAVAGGLLATGWALSGSDGAGPSTTTSRPLPTSSTRTVEEDAPPSRPGELTATVEGPLASVTWQPVDGATRYRVEFVVGGAAPELVESPEIVIDLASVPGACITVRGVDDQGRLGPASDPLCPAG